MPHGEGQLMVMGDIVLTDTEVNPVMAKLIAGGIEITALHNHLLRNAPHTMYMHIGGRGDPAQLAKVLHDALALSGPRSEERSVGKECVSTCRSRWSPYH